MSAHPWFANLREEVRSLYGDVRCVVVVSPEAFDEMRKDMEALSMYGMLRDSSVIGDETVTVRQGATEERGVFPVC